ncbi:MAG: hypothetical protein NTX45_22565, partial [Proteobacteria bacterium]|nr:hypothetical protein [Pseudomonadota bacterium]
KDPLALAGGLNLYAYVGNNPLNQADPMGLWWKAAVSIVAAVAVGIAVVALAPVALPVAIVLAGIAAGAVGAGLNEALNQETFCFPCILKAMARGGLVGGIAALPFAFLPAAAVIAAYMGVGAVTAGVGRYISGRIDAAQNRQQIPYGKKISNIPSRASTPAFKKDAQGNIVATPIDEPFNTRHGSAPYDYFKVQLYELELNDGTKIEAMKSLGLVDPNTGKIVPDNRLDTDCHGVTFTNGEYWINDTEVDKILDKGGYKPTSQPQTGDILVYREGKAVVHSVTVTKVDALGKVTEVSGLGGLEPAEHTNTPDTGWGRPNASKEYYSR